MNGEDRPEAANAQRPRNDSPASGDRHASVGHVLDAVRRYLYLSDSAPVLFALAVAVSRNLAGEPLWGLLVGPPSSAKTEIVRLLDQASDEHLDDLTAAGLLSWSRGKQPRRVGVLARVGDNALVSVGDLSSVLARSDVGMKDELFALLRRAYDGHVTRNLGQASCALEWRGRITLFAAVTGAIDSYSSHSDALGPRWLSLRLPELSAEQERRVRQRAREAQDHLKDHRERAARLAAECIGAATLRVQACDLTADAHDLIGDAAQVASLGRGTVKRSGYGRREIEGEGEREGTARLYGQLRHLARSLLALGISEHAAVTLATRAALDSMPLTRRKVVRALACGERLTAAEIARREGSTGPTIARSCEDLQALGGVDSERTEGAEDRRPRPWRLTGDYASLIARVFRRLDERETKTRDPTHRHTDYGAGPQRSEASPRVLVSPADSAEAEA